MAARVTRMQLRVGFVHASGIGGGEGGRGRKAGGAKPFLIVSRHLSVKLGTTGYTHSATSLTVGGTELRAGMNRFKRQGELTAG